MELVVRAKGCVVPAGPRIEPATTRMGVGPADFLPFGQTDCLPELLGLGSSGDKGGERGAEVTRVIYHPPSALFLAAASFPLSQTDQLPNLPHAEMVSGNSNGSDIS